MVFGNGVKSIQAAAYNGAHTVVDFLVDRFVLFCFVDICIQNKTIEISTIKSTSWEYFPRKIRLEAAPADSSPKTQLSLHTQPRTSRIYQEDSSAQFTCINPSIILLYSCLTEKPIKSDTILVHSWVLVIACDLAHNYSIVHWDFSCSLHTLFAQCLVHCRVVVQRATYRLSGCTKSGYRSVHCYTVFQ